MNGVNIILYLYFHQIEIFQMMKNVLPCKPEFVQMIKSQNSAVILLIVDTIHDHTEEKKAIIFWNKLSLS